MGSKTVLIANTSIYYNESLKCFVVFFLCFFFYNNNSRLVRVVEQSCTWSGYLFYTTILVLCGRVGVGCREVYKKIGVSRDG